MLTLTRLLRGFLESFCSFMGHWGWGNVSLQVPGPWSTLHLVIWFHGVSPNMARVLLNNKSMRFPSKQDKTSSCWGVSPMFSSFVHPPEVCHSAWEMQGIPARDPSAHQAQTYTPAGHQAFFLRMVGEEVWRNKTFRHMSHMRLYSCIGSQEPEELPRFLNKIPRWSVWVAGKRPPR